MPVDHDTSAARHLQRRASGLGGVDIVAVAAWLGDTVKMVYETYAHLMPNSDDRGRSAMNAFFMEEPSAPDVPSQGRK